MKSRSPHTLKRHALRLSQNHDVPVYLFSLAAAEILLVADISRIERGEAGELVGYQRPAVRRHVREITDYLNGEEVVFPNGIILSLSPQVRFIPAMTAAGDEQAVPGLLEIPISAEGDEKPGWIVDGQQRALALAQSKRGDLPVPISAFITRDIVLQRDQFLRINNTKPLPRGLITELLPTLNSPLPSRIGDRRVPSILCDYLNEDESSPFAGLIRRASTAKSGKDRAVVADTSLVLALEESIQSPSGSLFRYQNIATGDADIEGMARVLTIYWTAVRDVFPNAWGLPPASSRLMHGVGIRAMGRLMDRVMSAVPVHSKGAIIRTQAELKPLAAHCRWTSGAWEGIGGLPWNELQNTSRHVRLLADYLHATYVSEREEA